MAPQPLALPPLQPLKPRALYQEVAERLPEVFAGKPDADAAAAKKREQELFEQIGRLKMELEWLKKKAGELEC